MPRLLSIWTVMGAALAAFVAVLLAGCAPSEPVCERVIWRGGAEAAALNTPGEFRALIAAEIVKWEKIIKALGIQIK